MFGLYRRHLYVRIWLAVVAGVFILTLTANWIVRVAAENERERLSAVPRDVVVLDDGGRAVGSGKALRVPGQGLEFDVTLGDGRSMSLRVAPRDRQAYSGMAPWRTPFGLGWMIALVGVAVALGVYPIVRQLTRPEINDIAKRVAVIHCSSCGASVDIRKDHACPHCRSAFSLLDPTAVERALQGYANASKPAYTLEKAPDLADALLMLERDNLQAKRNVNTLRGSPYKPSDDSSNIDLWSLGIALVAGLLS